MKKYEVVPGGAGVIKLEEKNTGKASGQTANDDAKSGKNRVKSQGIGRNIGEIKPQ